MTTTRKLGKFYEKNLKETLTSLWVSLSPIDGMWVLILTRVFITIQEIGIISPS